MRTRRPYVQIDPDELERIRQIDLLTYLRSLNRVMSKKSKARQMCTVPLTTTA